jgi:hypothetical protein
VVGGGRAYGNDEVVFLRGFAHGEGEAIEQPIFISIFHSSRKLNPSHVLILQHNNRVRIANRRLEQTLRVLGTVRRHNLQAGNASIPRRVVLRVLRRDTRREAVGPAEGDVAGLDAAGHVVRLCGRVDDLVDGLHGEVERHELALSELDCVI